MRFRLPVSFNAPQRGRNFGVEIARRSHATTLDERMNAVPSQLLQQAEQLSEAVTRPIPGSRKIHVQGSRPDLRVPMREVVQSRTPTLFGGEENPAITVYDTSGPYSDPDARIDLSTGLPP